MELDEEELKATRKLIGVKRESDIELRGSPYDKTADEMFEELGYELIEDSKRYLRYAKYDDKTRYSGEIIDFDKTLKQFRLTRKTCQGNTHFKYGSLEELKAINKKCEELKWL